MHDLNQHLDFMELSSQLVAHTKELHNNVNRLSKVSRPPSAMFFMVSEPAPVGS